MRKSLFTTLSITLIIFAMAVSGGCARVESPTPDQQGQPARFGVPGTGTDTPRTPGQQGQIADPGRQGQMGDQGRMDAGTRNNVAGDPGANNSLVSADTDKKAREIVNQVTAMAPVQRATVAISGNTALIGVAVKGEQGDEEDRQLKSEIEEKVKDMSPEITNVVVSESPDLYKRIDALSKDIGRGTATQGLTDDFTELLNTMSPGTR